MVTTFALYFPHSYSLILLVSISFGQFSYACSLIILTCFSCTDLACRQSSCQIVRLTASHIFFLSLPDVSWLLGSRDPLVGRASGPRHHAHLLYNALLGIVVNVKNKINKEPACRNQWTNEVTVAHNALLKCTCFVCVWTCMCGYFDVLFMLAPRYMSDVWMEPAWMVISYTYKRPSMCLRSHLLFLAIGISSTLAADYFIYAAWRGICSS